MSLRRLVLRDFIIVAELDLTLTPGFTVLTGETGAGKSILIDALQLVTGGRADMGLIREGSERTEVSAEFDTTPNVQHWLEEAGFEADDALLLRRSVDSQGKSRAWINGSPATATQLRQIGEQLLDIHGQHAWQSLTRAEAVRGLLDAYAGVTTATLASLWQQWRLAQEELRQAQAAQLTLHSERERLSWQIGELEKLAPLPDEWDRLNTEQGRLSHAQALLDAAQGALQALDDDERNARNTLHDACQLLRQKEHLEPQFKALGEVLSSSLAQVQDSIHALRSYLRRTEPDPERLAELDKRLASWLSLARRYKTNPSELPDLLDACKRELHRLEIAGDLASLEQAQVLVQQAFLREAALISAARAHSAPELALAISQAMQGLGMQGGRFEVALQALVEPMQHGLEDVSFLVAGHAGNTPRPVSKVASGGELSRLALAIAVTTSRLGNAQTLIFDEIDAGVGGAVAETVGRLMRQLGQDRQVLAVTHLPQVAASADNHLVVSKRTEEQTTLSSLHVVQGAERVAEVARMLAGQRLSGASLAHAREMLKLQELMP